MTDIEVQTLERLERQYHEAKNAAQKAQTTLIDAEKAYRVAYLKRLGANEELDNYREQCKQVKSDASPDVREDPKK